MKKVEVEIEGLTPLLMNRYNIDAQLAKDKGRRISQTYDPDEEAEKAAYWSSTGKKVLVCPSEIIYSCILNASSFHKIGKRSAKTILAGSIRIEPAEISFGTSEYTVDTRAVVIQRSRVPKSRARLNEWKLKFNIIYNENQIPDPQPIRTVLEEAGQRIGIMDYRPQKSGSFGTFKVTKFVSN
jgi:hypothetical protein